MQIQKFDPPENMIKWILLIMLLIFTPTVVFLFLDYLVLPTGYSLLKFVIPSLFHGQLPLLFIANAVIWGLIFYFVSKRLAKKLATYSMELKLVWMSIALLLLLAFGFAPIYEKSPLDDDRTNLYGMYKQLVI